MENYPQISASPDQIDSETFHRVSTPPTLDSLGISQQESAPFSSDDMENYPQVSASPDQNRSDNTKRSKKNTSRAQKPWFPRLGIHKRKQRKQRNFTQISKKLSRTHKTLSTKIGKLQTKENVHQNFTTSNCISPSDMLPFLSRLLLKRPKVKVKHK